MTIETDAVWRQIRRTQQEIASAEGIPETTAFARAVRSILDEIADSDMTLGEFADALETSNDTSAA